MKSVESIYKRYLPSNTCKQVGSVNNYWFVFSLNKLLVTTRKDDIGIPFVKAQEELDIVPIRTQYLGTLNGQPDRKSVV